MKFFKNRIVKAVFWNALLGSAILTRAASSAGYVTRPNDTAWGEVRRAMAVDNEPVSVPEPILRRLETVSGSEDLRELVWVSYMGHDHRRLAELDRFWFRTLSERRETAILDELMRRRSELASNQRMNAEDYLQNWLWRAHHDPGHYDCGDGNGDNTSTPGCR